MFKYMNLGERINKYFDGILKVDPQFAQADICALKQWLTKIEKMEFFK